MLTDVSFAEGIISKYRDFGAYSCFDASIVFRRELREIPSLYGPMENLWFRFFMNYVNNSNTGRTVFVSRKLSEQVIAKSFRELIRDSAVSRTTGEAERLSSAALKKETERIFREEIKKLAQTGVLSSAVTKAYLRENSGSRTGSCSETIFGAAAPSYIRYHLEKECIRSLRNMSEAEIRKKLYGKWNRAVQAGNESGHIWQNGIFYFLKKLHFLKKDITQNTETKTKRIHISAGTKISRMFYPYATGAGKPRYPEPVVKREIKLLSGCLQNQLSRIVRKELYESRKSEETGTLTVVRFLTTVSSKRTANELIKAGVFDVERLEAAGRSKFAGGRSKPVGKMAEAGKSTAEMPKAFGILAASGLILRGRNGRVARAAEIKPEIRTVTTGRIKETGIFISARFLLTVGSTRTANKLVEAGVFTAERPRAAGGISEGGKCATGMSKIFRILAAEWIPSAAGRSKPAGGMTKVFEILAASGLIIRGRNAGIARAVEMKPEIRTFAVERSGETGILTVARFLSTTGSTRTVIELIEAGVTKAFEILAASGLILTVRNAGFLSSASGTRTANELIKTGVFTAERLEAAGRSEFAGGIAESGKCAAGMTKVFEILAASGLIIRGRNAGIARAVEMKPEIRIFAIEKSGESGILTVARFLSTTGSTRTVTELVEAGVFTAERLEAAGRSKFAGGIAESGKCAAGMTKVFEILAASGLILKGRNAGIARAVEMKPEIHTFAVERSWETGILTVARFLSSASGTRTANESIKAGIFSENRLIRSLHLAWETGVFKLQIRQMIRQYKNAGTLGTFGRIVTIFENRDRQPDRAKKAEKELIRVLAAELFLYNTVQRRKEEKERRFAEIRQILLFLLKRTQVMNAVRNAAADAEGANRNMFRRELLSMVRVTFGEETVRRLERYFSAGNEVTELAFIRQLGFLEEDRARRMAEVQLTVLQREGLIQKIRPEGYPAMKNLVRERLHTPDAAGVKAGIGHVRWTAEGWHRDYRLTQWRSRLTDDIRTAAETETKNPLWGNAEMTERYASRVVRSPGGDRQEPKQSPPDTERRTNRMLKRQSGQEEKILTVKHMTENLSERIAKQELAVEELIKREEGSKQLSGSEISRITDQVIKKMEWELHLEKMRRGL